tara:strand:- start:316 stop:597 length:282 start_codon:yes stop_codon:yes gene_type:complete
MTKVKIIDYKKKDGTGGKAFFWLHASINGESWMGHWYPDMTGRSNRHFGLSIRKHDETNSSWVRKASLRSKVTSALVVAELVHHMALAEHGAD